MTKTDKEMLSEGMALYGDLKEALREEEQAESDHGSNLNKHRAQKRAEFLADEEDHDYSWVH